MFDLVIRGGKVVDGTGGAPRSADVAITGDRIVEVGMVDGAARRVIHADGAVVAPGFVDVHTHYDGQATWDTQLAPSSTLGITTVVMGNCGVGFAPVHDHDRDRLIELMEGVEDIPGAALHEGLPWTWTSFGDYLDHLGGRRYDIDCGAQVPHGAIRLHAMGERGANREPATGDEIVTMARLAREAIEAGALGFTTSRTLNHRTSKGEPTPTLTAAREELLGIAAEIGKSGKGVLQVVSDFPDYEEEWETFRMMSGVSGRPMSISLAAAGIRPADEGRAKGYRHSLAQLERGAADGLTMRAQVAARAIGVVLGLQASLNPLMRCPSYQALGALPHDDLVRALRQPELRATLIAEMADHALRIRGFGSVFELASPTNYEPEPADSVQARAAAAGVSVEAFVYDLLLELNGTNLLYAPVLNYGDGNLDAVREMLAHPLCIPGLADGGAHVGTICDGSFATTLLTHWARDRTRGPRFPLEFVVAAQSRRTAEALGLNDRGVLAPGYLADVNVIDFEGLTLHAPEMHFDLPAGGKRLLQRADGYVHTIKSGTEIYSNGQATGALPGRLVRG